METTSHATEKPAADHFGDLLVSAIDRAGSPVCVGLDPVYERLPDQVVTGRPIESIEAFCLGVVDAIAGLVPVVKPQSACFERYGSAGVAVLERVVAHARDRGLVVLLDAKRGDIGVTSGHYAAAVSGMGAHAVTVNGYLGRSGIHPFLDRRLGVFVLVRTSNPDSDEIQAQRLENGRTVADMMAEMVEEIGDACRGATGISSVGAVIGATKAAASDHGGAEGGELARLRELLPDEPVLIPGVGAQGGQVSDLAPLVRRAVRPGLAGVLVTASRSVIYPSEAASAAATPWQDRVRAAAEAFAAEAVELVTAPANSQRASG